MLLGFAGGALFGMIADSDAAVADDTVIASISKQLLPGTTGLLIDVDENNPAVLDKLVADSGGLIFRYDYEETLSEIMSAEDAAEAASDEARRVIKENKKAERKAEREEKWDETKQKFKNFFHKS